MANAINNAFIDKVDKLCEKVTHSTVEMCPIDRLRKFLVNKGGPLNQFELKPIGKIELRRIISKRKGNRSSGIDFIDGYSIKLAAPLIEDILLHLVNLSISNSYFPGSWKFNKVIPQFKKGDRMLGENWRPILSETIYGIQITRWNRGNTKFVLFNKTLGKQAQNF